MVPFNVIKVNSEYGLQKSCPINYLQSSCLLLYYLNDLIKGATNKEKLKYT